MTTKPHPKALQLTDLKEGMWFRHFNSRGRQVRIAKVLSIDGTKVTFTPMSTFTGYIDECPLEAYELGLASSQNEDGDTFWNGYCLAL